MKWEIRNIEITTNECFNNVHRLCPPMWPGIYTEGEEGNTYKVEERFRCVCDCHNVGTHVYKITQNNPAGKKVI
jgi:hypothetical protein